MASVGHLAVGMAAARLYGTRAPTRRAWIRAVVFWSVLSFLPDADVIGFSLGVSYGDEWGHRGATHSFAFSIVLGALIGVSAPLFRQPALRTGVAASLVLVSHALLDTLTNGGLGCALFWPFDTTRYFAPWNPIPVAPIGLAFVSLYGLLVTLSELVLFAPLFWLAWVPAANARTPQRPRARGLLFASWLAAVWVIGSTDPVRERVVAHALRDDTEYAGSFSDRTLRTIENGQTLDEVRQRLGPPLFELLLYPEGPGACAAVRIEGETVAAAHPADVCVRRGVSRAASRTAVHDTLGPANGVCWLYSRSPGARYYYRVRGVCFANDRVVNVVANHSISLPPFVRQWLEQ